MPQTTPPHGTTRARHGTPSDKVVEALFTVFPLFWHNVNELVNLRSFAKWRGDDPRLAAEGQPAPERATHGTKSKHRRHRRSKEISPEGCKSPLKVEDEHQQHHGSDGHNNELEVQREGP